MDKLEKNSSNKTKLLKKPAKLHCAIAWRALYFCHKEVVL